MRAPVLRPRPSVRPTPLPGGVLTAVLGVRDAVEPALSHPRKCKVLTNLYPTGGGHWYGRPGFLVMGLAIASGAEVQGLYQYSQADGGEFTVGIAGGKFYTYDWAADAWTEVLTAADFTTATVTLASSGRVYFATFNDELVVNDGTNQPWTWDGTTNGGITKLTNAPASCFGQPWVYAAKLFFIKAAERNVFVWSEENAANTGYEAGGFNNAWTFTQTSSAPLFAGLGTNEAMYIFRDRSITSILGEVNEDFQSASTREAVSSTVGTTSPGSVVLVGRSVFFVDADGHPQLLELGGHVVGDGDDQREPIWEDCKETARQIDLAELGDIQGVYRPDLEIVVFSVQFTNRTTRDRLLTFDPGSGQYLGRHEGFQAQAIAVLKDTSANNAPRFCHGEDDGLVYAHGRPEESTWTDELNAGDAAIVHEIEGPAMFHDSSIEKHFSRADVLCRVWAGLHDLQFSYETPRGRSTSQAMSREGEEGTSGTWDVSLWDSAVWDIEDLEGHLAYGLDGNGRWIRPILRHNVIGERFGFSGLQVEAHPLARWPQIK